MSDREPLPNLTRRALLRAGAAAGAGLAFGASAKRAAGSPTTSRTEAGVGRSGGWPVTATYDFNRNWRFGGLYRNGAQDSGFTDRKLAEVTIPHTVVPLSWGSWDPTDWQRLWIYRKRFSASRLPLGRIFLDFDGVMTNATVYLNGQELASHLGGYLPFSVELTDTLVREENDLAVVVDGRVLDVPPLGSPQGARSADYLQPAGIHRDVTLRAVPHSYIADVFAKPADVLTGAPGLDVEVTLESDVTVGERATLTVDLFDGRRAVASTATSLKRIARGTQRVNLELSNLPGIALWSPSSPTLYTVRVALTGPTIASHTVEVTTGFREATFTTTGFYLNGERLQIAGLNRHGLYPYVGMAGSDRLQARDAELLKTELNCNMVRCSHYPQSPAFLDACDELGLMVWEEPPGWQYIGDDAFKSIFLANVHDMVLRDRNRPSVVVWGARLDETASYPTLYAQTNALIGDLDGTRQTTGAMDTRSTVGWSEDVFAYDDYNAVDGNAQLEPPLAGIPYIISESVGALEGPPLFRWIDSSATLMDQAKLHGQVQSQARSNDAYCGILAWCAVDYASLVGGTARVWANLRWPGVLDTFRVAKPGAAVYRTQLAPTTSPMIVPAFYWDFGPSSPASGPGAGAILATNCESLDVYVGGQLLTSATPDTTEFGDLPYPPVLVDLTVDGSTLPQLTVVGYVSGQPVATLQMSSDTSTDTLGIDLEDQSITGDGSDATRLTFRALDAYGNQRPYVSGDVSLTLSGTAAVIVGQNPFEFQLYGGVGGVFLRSVAGASGTVTVTATHPTLGTASATLTVVSETGLFL